MLDNVYEVIALVDLNYFYFEAYERQILVSTLIVSEDVIRVTQRTSLLQ